MWEETEKKMTKSKLVRKYYKEIRKSVAEGTVLHNKKAGTFLF